MITEETGYGTSGCPWKIKVSPGQQVALTVFDFNIHDNEVKEEYNSWCPISIMIEDEEDVRKDIPLCNGIQRENLIYTSIGNELLVHFVIRNMDKAVYFIVSFHGKIPSFIQDMGIPFLTNVAPWIECLRQFPFRTNSVNTGWCDENLLDISRSGHLLKLLQFLCMTEISIPWEWCKI